MKCVKRAKIYDRKTKKCLTETQLYRQIDVAETKLQKVSGKLMETKVETEERKFEQEYNATKKRLEQLEKLRYKFHKKEMEKKRCRGCGEYGDKCVCR